MQPENQNPQIRNTNLSWTDPVEIQGAFGNKNIYSFGTPQGQDRPQVFKKVFFKANILKQQFIQRVNELESLNHQNYLKVSHQYVKKEKLKKQEIVKEFTVISEYVESIPVSNFIKQKKQLYLSNCISIVQQMVNLMSYAQSKHIFHFHLNSDSFLLIQSESGSTNQIFVKICDWGYQNEICSLKQHKKLSSFLKKMCQNSMFQYLHPQLLFDQNNQNLYKEYKSEYDIWSFGIILYRLIYFKRPFQMKGGFSPQVLQEFYKGKKSLEVQNKTLIEKLIWKMLNLKGFQNWSEIKAFLIQNAQRSQTDFLGIKQLYNKQIRLISYLIQIYKLVAWNLFNSSNCFWYQNKAQLKIFQVCLLKIVILLHSKKFLERYGHRMIMLQAFQREQYDKIGKMIQNQWVRKGFSQSNLFESQNFFKVFDKVSQFLVPLQLRIDDYSSQKREQQKSSLGMRIRQIWPSIQILKSFSSNILIARAKIQNYNRNIFTFLFQIAQNQ